MLITYLPIFTDIIEPQELKLFVIVNPFVVSVVSNVNVEPKTFVLLKQFVIVFNPVGKVNEEIELYVSLKLLLISFKLVGKVIKDVCYNNSIEYLRMK